VSSSRPLDRAVITAFPDEEQRADALVPDRQGLGPGRGMAPTPPVDDPTDSDPVGRVSGLG